MITRSKSQRLTTPNLIVTIDQHASSSNTHNNEMGKSPSKDKGKAKDTASHGLPQLPNELILNILQQLSSPSHQPTLHACTLVNKLFHTFATPLLWYRPVMPYDTIVQRLFACLDHHTSHGQRHSPGQHIRQLHLHGNFLTDARFVHFLPHVSQLTSLEVSCSTRVTAAGIQWIPRHCQHLTSLHLESITLTRSILIAMGRYCRQLRQLYLGNCSLLQPNMLKPLIQHCPLEDLTMFGCNMNGYEETTIMDTMLCQHLTTLELSGPSHTTTKALFLLAAASTTSWPRLTKFFFRDCMTLDDPTWLAFIKTHPQLQDISLRDAWRLTDNSLDAMSVWLPHLTHVRIINNEKLSPEGVRRLIRNASSCLVSIRLIHCTRIQESDFPDLAFPDLFDYMIELDDVAIGKIRDEAATSAK